MSYDLYFGARDRTSKLDQEKVRAWFAARGYTFHAAQQALMETPEEDMLWDFCFIQEEDADFDRPLLASCSLPSAMDHAKKCINDARDFCQAFDLVVSDPQTDSLAFMEPDEYLVADGGAQS